MAMNLTQYHQLLDRALSEGDRDAAVAVLPEAIAKGRHRQGLLAWISAYGPFSTTIEELPPAANGAPIVAAFSAGPGRSAWDGAVSQFVINEPLFQTEEAVHVLADAMKANADLAEWDGQIDIWMRAPEDIRKSLSPPEEFVDDADIPYGRTPSGPGDVLYSPGHPKEEGKAREATPAEEKKGGSSTGIFLGIGAGLLLGTYFWLKKK